MLHGEFSDPWMSIPAGLASYGYVDEAVTPGTVVQYQVVAQDCTPSTSMQGVSPTVVIPTF